MTPHLRLALVLLVSLELIVAIGSLIGEAAATGKKLGKGFEAECLKAHNRWRRLHQVPELEFDKKIAVFAQKRADFIAASDGDEFKHPPDLPFGENLAWHSSASRSCEDLIRMWYDEVDLYDFVRGQFSHETGHFTQLVWRDTRRVGCAKSVSSGPKGGVYLVCNYDPPGNFLGEAVQNVLKRVEQARSSTEAPKTPSTRPTSASRATTAPTTTPTTTDTSSGSSTTIAVASSSTRSLSPELEAGSTTTRPAANKKKSNGKRKNKKGNKNKNKNKKKKNKKSKGRKKSKKPKSGSELESESQFSTPAPSQPAIVGSQPTPAASQ